MYCVLGLYYVFTLVDYPEHFTFVWVERHKLFGFPLHCCLLFRSTGPFKCNVGARCVCVTFPEKSLTNVYDSTLLELRGCGNVKFKEKSTRAYATTEWPPSWRMIASHYEFVVR